MRGLLVNGLKVRVAFEAISDLLRQNLIENNLPLYHISDILTGTRTQ